MVIITLIAYCAPHINPKTSGLVSLIGLAYPALLVCNLLFILFWIIYKSKKAALSLFVILIGYSSCNKFITFSLEDNPQKSKTSLVVSSYNINFSKPIAFAEEQIQSQLENDFNQYLQSLGTIDVLAVQEHGWRSKAYLSKAFNFPYIHEVEGMTVALYSKRPFVDVGEVNFNSNVANTCLWADIALGGDTIRVYSTHLESNRHDGKVPPVINQEAPEEMSNSALFGIVKHYQKFGVERAQQAELIQQHRKSSPHPTIICGDINDTPQTYVYKTLRGDMQDSFVEEGNGIGTTFGEKIPALRIDHVFVDDKFEVLDHSISRSDFSDHYLQLVKLEI